MVRFACVSRAQALRVDATLSDAEELDEDRGELVRMMRQRLISCVRRALACKARTFQEAKCGRPEAEARAFRLSQSLIILLTKVSIACYIKFCGKYLYRLFDTAARDLVTSSVHSNNASRVDWAPQLVETSLR